MAKQANQKRKLLVLQQILRRETDEQHPLTLDQLRAMLEDRGIAAERKSLYDDLEQLRTLGEDVVTVRDRTVRYYIGQRDFDMPELRLLVDAVQSSKFITRRKSDQLIRRLEGLTSRHLAGRLHRQVLVSGQIKHMNESIYYNVDSLQEAMGSNRQVTFRYFDWGMDKKPHFRRNGEVYTVSPWGLTWDNENYYLIGYEGAADSIRHYRVDRMQDIRVTDHPRQGEAAYRALDMEVYSRKTFGMFGGEEHRVTLRCSVRMAGVILDRFGQEIHLTPEGGTHFTARVPVVISPQFYGWLAGLEGAVNLVAPEPAVRDYQTYLAQLLNAAREDAARIDKTGGKDV